jgi:hypothetical protein
VSAESVQQAIADYITAAAIPKLMQCFAVPPFDLEDVNQDALTPAGQTSSGIAVVYTDSDDEEGADTSMDGAGGRRVCTYQISLEVMYWDVSGDYQVAMGAYDTAISAIKTALRTDPQLGTASTPGVSGNGGIIQAAYSRLHVERGRPVLLGDGNAPTRWGAVQFPVETYEFST